MRRTLHNKNSSSVVNNTRIGHFHRDRGLVREIEPDDRVPVTERHVRIDKRQTLERGQSDAIGQFGIEHGQDDVCHEGVHKNRQNLNVHRAYIGFLAERERRMRQEQREGQQEDLQIKDQVFIDQLRFQQISSNGAL